MSALDPQDITELTIIYTDDPTASWLACAEAWKFDADANRFPAEIVGKAGDGSPLVSHGDAVYMLTRYHEPDTNDWFITAKTYEQCRAHTVFWPDVEAIDADCILPKGHGEVHADLALGEWREDDLMTTYPDEA